MAVCQNAFVERFLLYLHGNKFLIGRIVFVIFAHSIICMSRTGKVGITEVLLGSKEASSGLWLNRCWQWPQQEHVRSAGGGEKLASSPNAFWDDAVVVISVAIGIW